MIGELEIVTELGKGSRTIVWSSVSTAGGDGRLFRCIDVPVSGTSVVVIV